MDIATVDATLTREDTPAIVPLNGPDGKPDYASDGTRATISIVGTYSPRYRAAERAWQDARQETPGEPTSDDVTIELAVWAVVDWHGIESSGVPLPCTPDNVRLVLTKAPWVSDQIRIALNKRDGFFAVASAA